MLAVDGEIRASHRRTPSDETAAGRAKGACRSKSYRVHLCARGFAFPACCTHASISSHGRTSMLIPTVTAMDERHTPDGQASAAYMRLELRRLRQWPGPCPDQCAPNRRTPPCECRSPPTWRSHLSPPPPAPLVSRRLPSPPAPTPAHVVAQPSGSPGQPSIDTLDPHRNAPPTRPARADVPSSTPAVSPHEANETKM
jgi:hypothetical protein